jgi:IS5 family transposase
MQFWMNWNTVPDDTTPIKWANLLRPETLHQLQEHMVVLAHRLKVTRGRNLRTDGTVIESNIHPLVLFRTKNYL